jgi:hypothetical protein
MFGLDLGIDIADLQLWIAATSAALLFAMCVIALARPRRRTVSVPGRVGVIAACAVLGASLTWAFFGSTPSAPGLGFAGERRALEQRAQDLTLRALEPGSPFACLDGLAGDSIEAACQKALFATPATVAAVTAYVTARFNLLSDMVSYVGRGGSGIDSVLAPMRRSLEADRFGFLAHALSVRDSCTSEDCKALNVLRDPSRVRTNLGAETFDHILEPYLVSWAQPADTPMADASSNLPPAVLANTRGPRKAVNIDFPSAASIPAVSIMNTEPNTRPQPSGPAVATAKLPAAPSSAKARKQSANPAPQALTPATPEDPVWQPSTIAPAPASQAATAAPPAATVRTQ